MFESLDHNKDGTISVQELKFIIEKVDLNMTDEQFESLINSLDKNDDDKIEFNEFYNVMSNKYSNVNRKEDLKRTFNYFDSGSFLSLAKLNSQIMKKNLNLKKLDGSGSIERKELYDIMKRFNPDITHEEVSASISKVDDDQSGKISFEGCMKFYFLLKISNYFCILNLILF